MTITADSLGVINCKFTIPAGIPSGKKRVTMLGNGGSYGETFFEGKGELWQENRHTTTTITTTTNQVTTDYYQNNYGIGYYGWYGYGWYNYPYYWRHWGGGWYWGYYGCGWYDPLAQTFRLQSAGQIAGVELFVRQKGDTPITVQIRKTENGVPTDNLLTISDKLPSEVMVGQWNTWEFPEPILLEAEVEYAIVVLCNDADAELGIAEMGKWDNIAGKWVTSQPYTVGVLLSSSNASSWTVHQDRDLAFRLLSPTYQSTTKQVVLGEIDLVAATDIALAVEHMFPSSSSKVIYTANMPDGSVLQMTPGAGVQLGEEVTGQATIKAIISGTNRETPVVSPGAQLIQGSIQNSAQYVSRAIEAGTNVKAVLVLDTKIPTGSSLKAEWKGANSNTWHEFPAPIARGLDQDWAELTYTKTGITETMIQTRLTITGTTSARPMVSNLRLYTA